MSRRVVVYGSAYLDRVLRVDGPLLHPSRDKTLDRSIEAQPAHAPSEAIKLIDPEGGFLAIEPPENWPGPWGQIRLGSAMDSGTNQPWKRSLKGLSWHDDLGGMGAGFAKALGGRLVCFLGSEFDADSATIEDLLFENGIAYRPIRTNHPADWTLLISSGEHGDKLPLGFRGCLAALDQTRKEGLITRKAFIQLLREHAYPEPIEEDSPAPSSEEGGTLTENGEGEGSTSSPAIPEISPDNPPDLVVVSGLTNRLALSALRAWPESIRLLAPAMRNMIDRARPLITMADEVDILCCNREEWEALPESDRDLFLERLSLLSITDGPDGAIVRFRDDSGGWDEVVVPAFPRHSPPLDTNRAGETFATTLVSTLLDSGWRPGPADPALVQKAALRASVAAALQLDLDRFGFPTSVEIDEALSAGAVESRTESDLERVD